MKSQRDSTLPADGRKVILNKMNNKSKTNRKRTNIDKYTSCSVRVKDFYSSINQNSGHIIQDSSLRWNKTSTQQQDLTLEQQKSNGWTPVGRTKIVSNPSQLNWKLYAGAIIKPEARPAGVQLKRVAKLLTVIGLTTKHAGCSITFMLYPILL